MTELVRELANITVAPGTVHAWWLGGTGFVFKTPAGTTIYVDPYLSNMVAQIFGVERGFPAPITAQEARPDLVISTHWHEDHLDPGTLPTIAQQSNALFMTTPGAQSRLLSWGVPRERVQPIVSGDSLEFRDVGIRFSYDERVNGRTGERVSSQPSPAHPLTRSPAQEEWVLRHISFTVPRGFRRAEMAYTIDDVAEVYVNGQRVAGRQIHRPYWGQHGGASVVDLGPFLVEGRNVVAVEVQNLGGPRGFNRPRRLGSERIERVP